MNKNGLPSAKAAVLTEEGFAEQKEFVEGKVAEIATKMKSGNANASPMRGQKDPCQYCSVKPVCRNFRKREEDDNA